MMEGHFKNAKTIDTFRTVCYKEAEQPYKPGEGMMVATSMTTSRLVDLWRAVYQKQV